ncbi:OLC1v1028270C1 [Oldenlandia corymbosa var. corymbosa]|uniref:OLC1v1028270C1 n=1 Tax=Oldenlandia corymbosa var. corymbosa TaxID=529605 RepID=A0AAV1CEE6_OLDCO|nr:OLC1v1028270C1 [Oldenlandia corymbosa var. corymbosa]
MYHQPASQSTVKIRNLPSINSRISPITVLTATAVLILSRTTQTTKPSPLTPSAVIVVVQSDTNDQFTNYALTSVFADNTFNSYGTKATSGTGDFSNYQDGTTVAGLNFTSYSDGTGGRSQDFTSYAENTTAGDEGFASYGGKQGNDNFTSYGLDERIPENDFNNYARDGNGTTETFTSYGRDGNIPLNNFNTYGSGGNEITQKFANYRDLAVVGDNRFRSYGEDSKTESLGFTNYGQSFITDTFREYGKDSNVKKMDFNTYGVGNTFVEYTKTGVKFSNYLNETQSPLKMNSRRVEPGKFFREKMLRTETLMPMPDIKDKMPKRSFLPRTILSKIPFSRAKIDELKKIFNAADDSSMTRILRDALTECERAPSPGETKRCAGSGEDMIDFATSVLGRNIAVRSTDNTRGSGGDIMIGTVIGINGGQLTKSVSCHQSLYPYLLYYCHSVPKVRVYEADILDPKSKAKINHGVTICHIDTSSWSRNHGAFVALGSGPGKIEVCHWIFENDMTWTISD